MKKLSILFFSLLIIGYFLSSCSTIGEGAIVQEQFDLAAFDGVDLAGGFNVEVTLGDTQSVMAEGHQNIIDRLQMDIQNDGTLRLKLNKGIYKHYKLTIYITVPTADKFCISGAGDMTVYQSTDSHYQETEDLKLQVSGAGDLKGIGDFIVRSYTNAKISGSGNINFNLTTNTMDAFISGAGNLQFDVVASKIDAKIDGSGDIRLSGTVDEQDIQIKGAGDFRGFDFISRKADVRIVGSGNIECYVTEDLNVKISGSGDVRYKGDPGSINSSVTGTGYIRSAD